MLSEALLLQFDRYISVEISYVGYAVTLFSRKRTAPHVDRIAMRDAAVGHAAELSPEIAPLHGFGCEKAVVLAFDHAHDEVGKPEEHVASDLFAGERIALIIDVGIIGIGEVELAGRGCPEALDRIIGMRIAVTKDLKPDIRHESSGAHHEIRKLQELIDRVRAVVRSLDSRDRSDKIVDLEGRDRVADIKSALAVGDDIELLDMLLGRDLPDPLREEGCVALDRAVTVLITVIDCCALALKNCGDPAPVIQMVAVAKAHAVNEQERISEFVFCRILQHIDLRQ